jgi:hypothetical protein
VNVINIHNPAPTLDKWNNREGVMPIVAKLDELGRPAWILLMILGFMVWWPVGFMVLAFIIGERTNRLQVSPGQDGAVRPWRLVGLPQFQPRL